MAMASTVAPSVKHIISESGFGARLLQSTSWLVEALAAILVLDTQAPSNREEIPCRSESETNSIRMPVTAGCDECSELEVRAR